MDDDADTVTVAGETDASAGPAQLEDAAITTLKVISARPTVNLQPFIYLDPLPPALNIRAARLARTSLS